MPFTGGLGTPDSGLSDIGLGSLPSGSGRTSQSLQLKARIQAAGTQGLQLKSRLTVVSNQSLQIKARLGSPLQTFQAKANLFGVSDQSLQLKARVAQPSHSIQLKAHIRGVESFQAKARIIGFLQSRLEVDFNILVTLHQRLTVVYNVGDKQVSYRAFQAKASILRPVQARLAVEYAVCYTTPNLPVVRPTQRTNVRGVQTLLMKARIRAR